MERTLIIQKILNNSAVLVQEDDQEFIYIGPGIAFGKKAGMVFDDLKKVEKVFSLKQKAETFQRLLNHHTQEIAYVMDAVRILLETVPDVVLDENQLLAFCDHVAIMYERVLKNEPLLNPFLYETKALYKDSFQLALLLSNHLEELNGVVIPESETGYIALHIQSILQDKDRVAVECLNSIMAQIKDLLEEDYHIDVDTREDEYGRFINHIKFLINRVFQKSQMQNDLRDMILRNYAPYREVAQKVANIIEAELHNTLSEDEIAFLMIHMNRLVEIKF